MKIDSADFAQLVQRVLQNGQLTHMRPVIEKEILHYDILFCLDQAGLLDDLVFQGGTSLRLCYGGHRFSEDLDFVGGTNFSSRKLASMKTCIKSYIGKRYGLEVTVKEPDMLKKEPAYAELKISKWQIAITTAPKSRDLPKQRIKIEVANIPAYTRNPLSLRSNYDLLPDGYNDTLIYTETLNEIMADKLVSLPATQKYVRHRDIWDLAWLQQQGAVPDSELVGKKINDYKLNQFDELIDQRIRSLPDVIAGDAFTAEMKRFLPYDVFERTLGKVKFTDYLASTVIRLLQEVKGSLYGVDHTPGDFLM